MKKIKLVVVGVMMMLCGMFASGAASAESGSTPPTLTVSPVIHRIILTPGETYSGSLMISNASDADWDLKYTVSVGSFSQHPNEETGDDYGAVDVDEVTTYNQIMDWITIDKKTGQVEPNGADVVNFTIKVPESAPAGGQYATILVENTSDETLAGEGDGSEGAGVTIQSVVQMASIIYADVAGETHKEGYILENKIPSFLFSDELEATSMVENQGNVHDDATFWLQVWPMFGGDNVCTTKDVTEDEAVTSLVLPGTKRLHKETCKLPGPGIYKVKQTVTIFGEESVIEGTLIYCPIWTILMIVFGIALAIIWLLMMTASKKKKNQMTQ